MGNLQRMPLADSMEKPPTAERAAGPIAVFSDSYARLPEYFFARLSPTPVAKARLIKINESLASELGSIREVSNRTSWRQCLPATSRRRAPSRSRWPMPGINSAILFLSLATAAQSSLAMSWTATARARSPVEGRGRHCHVAMRRARAVQASRIFKPPRQPRATWSSPRCVARGEIELT
jgi:hypothetical protein